MPSLVKSNSALASGGIALLEQSVGTRSSTELVISARFVALKAYMEKWAALLQPGSLSPLPLSYAGNALSATNEPRLNAVSVSVQAGLAYFDCQFSAQRALTNADINDPLSLISSSSTMSLQTFSGAEEFSIRDVEETVIVATEFDYYAETKSVAASSSQIVQIASEQLTVNSLIFVGPFNVRGASVTEIAGGGFLIGGSPSFNVFPSVVYSYSQSKNENGSVTYSVSASVRLLRGYRVQTGQYADSIQDVPTPVLNPLDSLNL